MNDFVRYIRKCNITLSDDIIITNENVKCLGEYIAVSAIRRVMHYQGERGYKLYLDLVHDIIYEKQPNETFSDGYDIASEAICFLCEHIGKPLGKVLTVNSKGRELNIRDICFKTVFRYIYGNQKYESNIADLEQPNLMEMSVPFESESITEAHSTDVNKIMRKIGLNDKEKLTIKLIMGGMTPYAVSRYLKMSNHGIYNRVNRAREKYIKTFGMPYTYERSYQWKALFVNFGRIE